MYFCTNEFRNRINFDFCPFGYNSTVFRNSYQAKVRPRAPVGRVGVVSERGVVRIAANSITGSGLFSEKHGILRRLDPDTAR
jgi:hypothetical protein